MGESLIVAIWIGPLSTCQCCQVIATKLFGGTMLAVFGPQFLASVLLQIRGGGEMCGSFRFPNGGDKVRESYPSVSLKFRLRIYSKLPRCVFRGQVGRCTSFMNVFLGYGRVYEVYKVLNVRLGPLHTNDDWEDFHPFPCDYHTDSESPFFEVWRMVEMWRETLGKMAEILPSVVSVVVYLLMRSFLWR